MHYNAVLESLEVGGDVIDLPTSALDKIFGSGDQNMAIFDSGTTLAYLPPEMQEPLVKKVYMFVNSNP